MRDKGQAWNEAMRRLEAAIGTQRHEAWFTTLCPEGRQDGVLLLSVQKRFVRSWIKLHHASHVLEAFAHGDPTVTGIAVHAREAMEHAGPRPGDPPPRPEARRIAPRDDAKPDVAARHARPERDASHRFAGAQEAWERASAFCLEPRGEGRRALLVVEGAAGSGRTRFLEDMVERTRAEGGKAAMVGAQRLMRGHHDARLAKAEGAALLAALADHDLVAIDDVHLHRSKEAADALEALVAGLGTAMVAVAASTLAGTGEAGTPRAFAGAERVAVSGPDGAERAAFMDAHARHQGMALDGALVGAAAAAVGGNMHHVLQVARKLCASACAAKTGGAAAPALGDEGFAELVRVQAHKPSVEHIQHFVSGFYGIDTADMRSESRVKHFVRPRQIAMAICKSHTERTLPEIGRRFGGRDHTTVLHAVRKIAQLRREDPGLDERIARMEEMLKTG